MPFLTSDAQPQAALFLSNHHHPAQALVHNGEKRVKKHAFSVAPASKHTPADQAYIDGLSARQLMDFRNYVFTPTFVTLNATKFLDHGWIDMTELRQFIDASRTPAASAPLLVKMEPSIPAVPPPPPLAIAVKTEPQGVGLPQIPRDIKMRAKVNKDDQEVIEILSDSESDSDLEVIEALRPASRSSSAMPHRADLDDDQDHQTDSGECDAIISSFNDPENDSDDDSSDLVESDTVWLDGGVSFVRSGTFRPSQKVTVQRMEYRDGPAAIYPIHRVRTGIVVDLSNEEYHHRDPSTKELYSLTSIIQKADNDSWEPTGGKGTAKVMFAPGEEAIDCYRVRYTCKGAHACERLDEALRTAVRFELDSAGRASIVAAQHETRRSEGNTPEERVALQVRFLYCGLKFMKVIRDAKCCAVDSSGKKCQGGPILKPKSQGTSRGHQHYIGCSGSTPKFKDGHFIQYIPDHVDENLLAKGLAGQALTDDPSKDTQPCSGIIHPHTGLKRKFCPHAHIVDGTPVRARIINYACDATRYTYVPKDSSIRKVLIIHNESGHNHPMPALTKLSLAHKVTYRQCIEANGVLGATVSKIDNAQSTKMLLNGKTPAAHAPPLYNKRAKRDLLRAAKIEKYPDGLDVEGVEGKINEWEMTIFAKVVQRAVSLLRAYINRSSTDLFEQLFDELQHVKLTVTGKPIPLKKFVRGGNLLVTNFDMDTAQVIGFCRSVMKYNDPEYSGIPNDTPPEEVAPEFIKICWRHAKEPVHDFRALVSPEVFDRIKDFVYIDSKESLDDFSKFIYGLKIKKITGWWKHKEIHPWIIPCLVKSQSRLPADVWDSTPSTTNTNEAQHHWTNSLTDINRRTVDLDVAQDIKMSLTTGILSNFNNEMSHRMSRNCQRQSASACNAHKSREGQFTASKGTSGGRRRKSGSETVILSASSSGRVKTVRVRKDAPAVLETQAENTSIPATCPVVDPPHSGEPPITNFSPMQPPAEFKFNLTGFPALDFDALMADVSFGGSTPTVPPSLQNPALSPFDPTLFDFTSLDPSHFEISMPIAGSSEDPLQDFLDMYPVFTNSSGAQFGAVAPPNLNSIYTLPLLPPPPAQSPPAPSLQPASRSRRARKEVDTANIVTSTRARGPAKRFADEEYSNLPRKKAKTAKVPQLIL
ncbi:hypothetical protein DFH09DRAFT_1094940 [Mycena vulgaris]|nr:hypothetical protein DFH09DRAFT_1094940 [Mycena vulgaris]